MRFLKSYTIHKPLGRGTKRVAELGITDDNKYAIEIRTRHETTKVYRNYVGTRRYAGCWVTGEHQDVTYKPYLKKVFDTEAELISYFRRLFKSWARTDLPNLQERLEKQIAQLKEAITVK